MYSQVTNREHMMYQQPPTLPLSYHYSQWKMLKALHSKAYKPVPLCHIEELS